MRVGSHLRGHSCLVLGNGDDSMLVLYVGSVIFARRDKYAWNIPPLSYSAVEYAKTRSNDQMTGRNRENVGIKAAAASRAGYENEI